MLVDGPLNIVFRTLSRRQAVRSHCNSLVGILLQQLSVLIVHLDEPTLEFLEVINQHASDTYLAGQRESLIDCACHGISSGGRKHALSFRRTGLLESVASVSYHGGSMYRDSSDGRNVSTAESQRVGRARHKRLSPTLPLPLLL